MLTRPSKRNCKCRNKRAIATQPVVVLVQNLHNTTAAVAEAAAAAAMLSHVERMTRSAPLNCVSKHSIHHSVSVTARQPGWCTRATTVGAATSASGTSTVHTVPYNRVPLPYRCFVRSFATAAAVAAGSSAGSDGSTLGSSSAFTELQLAQLWDSVSRALLRLGRTGVTDAHCRSLGELLAAHKLVKVQLNGVRAGEGAQAVIVAAAEALAERSGGAATLLHVKGSTMLFGASGSPPAELLAVAEAAAAGTQAWRLKRQAAAAQRAVGRTASEAKRHANASRSRRRIGQLINTVAQPGKGGLDRATLAAEWQQLEHSISSEEAALDAKSGGAAAATPARRSRAPWRRQQP